MEGVHDIESLLDDGLRELGEVALEMTSSHCSTVAVTDPAGSSSR